MAVSVASQWTSRRQVSRNGVVLPRDSHSQNQAWWSCVKAATARRAKEKNRVNQHAQVRTDQPPQHSSAEVDAL